MEATKRIQLNIDVRPYRIGPNLLNINDTIFPVLWINEVILIELLQLMILFKIFFV